MTSEFKNQFYRKNATMNLTPIIDIVFLLIIFFVVVSQFIDNAAVEIDLPDQCRFAESDPESLAHAICVNVTATADGQTAFDVSSIPVAGCQKEQLVSEIAQIINKQLATLPEDQRIVTLRVDKRLSFGDAQHALAGIAASDAVDIAISTFRDAKPVQ